MKFSIELLFIKKPEYFVFYEFFLQAKPVTEVPTAQPAILNVLIFFYIYQYLNLLLFLIF
jgi:hypothetical protein